MRPTLSAYALANHRFPSAPVTTLANPAPGVGTENWPVTTPVGVTRAISLAVSSVIQMFSSGPVVTPPWLPLATGYWVIAPAGVTDTRSRCPPR